jgi:pimeloyl-ACP methyl ester carboxylesterase
VSNQELAAASTGLGDLPLVVLTHGEPLGTAEDEAAWQAAQAKYSTRSRLVVAEQSGHGIPLDQPKLVVAAVREVVQESGTR